MDATTPSGSGSSALGVGIDGVDGMGSFDILGLMECSEAVRESRDPDRIGGVRLLACLFLLQFVVPPAVADSFGDPAPPISSWAIPIEAAGLHNVYALGTNVYSGSSPEGREGFASLAKLGVKTIITVDGATPDVEAARESGMRYVHLPCGYDGIGTNIQLLLVKAGQDLPGPIYVHCHHGKHRGPAAAAVLCMADQGWNAEQAEAFLVRAGTSTNYAGLYQTIRTFRVPSEARLRALPADFPEIAPVSGLVEAMVGVDARWDNLKAVRAAGYRVPPDHPDIDPANEAVILWEHFREARRLPEVRQQGEDLIRRFSEAEAQGKQAERLLMLFGETPRSEIEAQLDRTFDAVNQSCSSCHKAYRNPARITPEL